MSTLTNVRCCEVCGEEIPPNAAADLRWCSSLCRGTITAPPDAGDAVLEEHSDTLWLMTPDAPTPAPIPSPPAWHADAACLGMDPDLWFPTKGRTATRGLQVCEGCPVRDECRQWAIGEGFEHGTFGGETAEVRAPQLEHRFGPPERHVARTETPPAPDKLCACSCGRLVPAGAGATHPTCRQRAYRQRRQAAA